jgi:7-keto-8-aminopelargonate synthetase-like enzyme
VVSNRPAGAVLSNLDILELLLVVTRAADSSAQRPLHFFRPDRREFLVQAARPAHPLPSGETVVPAPRDRVRGLRRALSLREAGFLAPAIRPPSVAEGRARVRVSLNTALSGKEIRGLADAVSAFRDKVPRR